MRPRAPSLPALAGLIAPLVVASVAVAGPPDGPPDGQTPPNADDPAPAAQPGSTPEETKALAKAAVKQAATAFSEGDYAAALAGFDRAMQLRPSPKLHYNIAVCHFYLMQATADETKAAFHKTRAIEAYQAYLEQRPDAADRQEVEEALDSLGAKPKPVGLREIDPDAFAAQDEETDVEQVEAPPPLTATQAPSRFLPQPKKIRIQASLYLGVTPQQWSLETIGGNVLLSGEVRFSGLVGKKRNGIVGATAGFGFGNDRGRTALLPTFGYLGFEGGWGITVGKRLRFEFTGLAAAARQSIRVPPGVDAPETCSLRGGEGEALVGARWGGLLALRPTIGVFVDRRQHHEVNYQVMPALGLWSPGPSADDCDGGQSPHQALDAGQTALFNIFAGFGYVARF